MYPFHYLHEVEYGDIDAFGHVNSIWYFRYMETARVKYTIELFGKEWRVGSGSVVASAACDYKSASFFGETLKVEVGVARLGSKSFDLAYRMSDLESGRLVCLGKTVQVLWHVQERHTLRIPDEFRQRVEAYQNGWRLDNETR
jgi:acyl-CoA thioester hydrolase